MNTTYLSIAAIVLYIPAILMLWQSCFNQSPKKNNWLTVMIIAAWLIQGAALHFLIDLPVGQNLSLTNLSAMVAWIMVAMLVIGNLRSQVQLMFIIILLITIISQLFAQWWPSERIFKFSGNLAAVLHVLTSLLAYSFLALAAIQAIFIWWLDDRLKNHQTPQHPVIPPLLALEQLLFQLLRMGYLVLTLSIAIGFIFLENFLATQTLHKLILSLLSWLLFSLLLAGHWKYGWRGRQAAKWTLTAFFILALGSFGTWMVTTMILNR